MMDRRSFIGSVASGFLALPLGVFAQQQGQIWRIGFLGARSRSTASNPDALYDAFIQGMRDLGYIEGKNLVIEWRFADAKYERLPALAAELVQLKVEVIVTHSTPASQALQRATSTIPIVIASADDPVGAGLVKSLAHPGGNITGLSDLSGDLGPKQFEMLRTVVSELSQVAVLVNPASHTSILKEIETAAQNIGVKILPVEARTPREIDNAFSMMAREKAGAVIVVVDAAFIQQRRQIAELAAKDRLPSISSFREYVEAGGLMSYGANITERYRRAATYVDQILKGAKPGDLPVEQPTTFELVINQKTAKALGITIPQSLLINADKVIE